jgi:hypothetical protein
MDELLGLSYVVGNLEMSSFHANLNHRQIPLIAPEMFQTIHKGLV